MSRSPQGAYDLLLPFYPNDVLLELDHVLTPPWQKGNCCSRLRSSPAPRIHHQQGTTFALFSSTIHWVPQMNRRIYVTRSTAVTANEMADAVTAKHVGLNSAALPSRAITSG